MKRVAIILCVILAAYLVLFVRTERHFRNAKQHFSAPLTAPVMEVALGFLKHIGAEMLYVKAAVFLGAPPKLLPPEIEVAESLAQNFDVVTDLYPEFKDAYFLTQSSIAHISPEYAGRAIAILDKGVKAYPDDMILPFFKGFDHYYYRDEAAHAAEIFAELAQRPGAPSWLGHLAAILSARGGDLRAGLLSLQVMYAMEEDKQVKQRYAEDIEKFKEAIRVFEATETFKSERGVYPEKLRELVPGYLAEIPDFGNDFELLWIPPRLRLIRPVK